MIGIVWDWHMSSVQPWACLCVRFRLVFLMLSQLVVRSWVPNHICFDSMRLRDLDIRIHCIKVIQFGMVKVFGDWLLFGSNVYI